MFETVFYVAFDFGSAKTTLNMPFVLVPGMAITIGESAAWRDFTADTCHWETARNVLVVWLNSFSGIGERELAALLEKDGWEIDRSGERKPQ